MGDGSSGASISRSESSELSLSDLDAVFFEMVFLVWAFLGAAFLFLIITCGTGNPGESQ